MTAAVFVDTNIFVYARDPRDYAKRARAAHWLRVLWSEQRGRTSLHVLSEYYAVVTRKLKVPVPREDAWDDVQTFMCWGPQQTDAALLSQAYEIEQSHQLNWWDCLVVAAAQAQGCALLLTEDLQDGALFGDVTVRNPFTLGVAEAASAYVAAPKVASRYRGRGRPRTQAKRSPVSTA
jgi:predicted nucleic acid-binding protein